MHTRHTFVVVFVLAVTLFAGAVHAQDDMAIEAVVNDANGGIAPTDAAVFGSFRDGISCSCHGL